ncbi:uncharacterized protein LOC143604542 [Bidens hawaiensis]|uniref:uncharacterized protein LOC143604542 n=1 Tax=Bidens hawaiensis TaxID=980011 RepID=UPI0040492EAE
MSYRYVYVCFQTFDLQPGLQRCGKSCRLRWLNYLRPGIKRGSFSQPEQDIILLLRRLLGNRWAQIAKNLPGRTDNEIKNFWHLCLKKKLINQGFDPNTHEPIPIPKESHKSIISSAMTVELQEAIHKKNNDELTLEDDFMKNIIFSDELEMGIDSMWFDCNLFARYDQMSSEKSSPSFDFSDTLASTTMMDIKEESRESSSCTNYSNLNNLSAEIFKHDEWNASKWQELQNVQVSNARDSDTLLSENLLEAFFTN